jgi:hypothetical protein
VRAAGDILASATGGTDLARAARSGVAWTRRVVVAISEEESAAGRRSLFPSMVESET